MVIEDLVNKTFIKEYIMGTSHETKTTDIFRIIPLDGSKPFFVEILFANNELLRVFEELSGLSTERYYPYQHKTITFYRGSLNERDDLSKVYAYLGSVPGATAVIDKENPKDMYQAYKERLELPEWSSLERFFKQPENVKELLEWQNADERRRLEINFRHNNVSLNLGNDIYAIVTPEMFTLRYSYKTGDEVIDLLSGLDPDRAITVDTNVIGKLQLPVKEVIELTKQRVLWAEYARANDVWNP